MIYVHEFLRRFLYTVRLWHSYFLRQLLTKKSQIIIIAQKWKMATIWTLSSQQYSKQELLTCPPNQDDFSVLKLALKCGSTPRHRHLYVNA